MRHLTYWFNMIIKKRREFRRWQRIVMVLAAVITFTTTYALILPAITVERNHTDDVGGMFLEQSEDNDGMRLDNALEPSDVSIDAEQGNMTVSEDGTVETDAEIPDYDYDQEGDDPDSTEDVTDALPIKTLKTSGSDYTVTLAYDETAGIPERADLTVSEIDQESEEYQTYLAETKKAMGLVEEETLPRFAARFFDIKIMVDEQEFTPESGVSVEITYEEPLAENPDTEVNAVHFADEAAKAEMIEADTSEVLDGGTATVEFTADSFSVYGVVYTVDFHYEVDGELYEFSMHGGGFVSLYRLVETLGIETDDADTEKDEIQELVDGIESVEFSSPELVAISKVEEDTTLGEIKDLLGLECEYSSELTEEQIDSINAEEIKAGDWALISLKPFTSEETLTVIMKNGETFTIRVTDAQVTSLGNIDENKSYVIYTRSNGSIYVLKTDGSTEIAQESDLDGMDNNYKWKFEYVYTDINTGISYYIIRPCDDNTKYLYLSWDTTFPWSNPNNVPLVRQGSGNVMVIPSTYGTFRFEGYNNTKLVLENGWFAGRRGNSYNRMVIYEQGQISQYKYNVSTDDYAMGKVCGWNDQNQYKEDAEFDAVTNDQKTNQRAITAQPQTARYIFDYWDLNGTPLDYGATIPANSLTIPYQGSKLTAHFKKDPNYVAPDEEKEGRVIDKESFQKWLQELRERNIPLNQDECTKTAEVYDYENRIYRVDLAAKSNLSMFDGDIDLGFIIDVSGSMQFPSKLDPIAGYESIDVLHLNDNDTTKNSIDKNKTYYFVVDRTNTANVIRLKWGRWPTGNPSSHSTQWYDGWGICGLGYEEDALDGATRYYTSAGHALFGGDNGPFQLYTAGDNGKRRREYLESSIAGTITELNNILGDLAYAQNADEAADVKIAYNTFANDVDYNHTNHNFVSVKTGLSIGYDYKGGTDTEEALIDADSFFWNDSATKVAVLITDGAPQQTGVDGPTLDAKVKAAAKTLRDQGIKLVTVGLSMGDVKRGSRLLYDIATKDSDGDPYFYKADTGDELQYALYEVIQQVMTDAIVVGKVTDTVNEAFYPVDKDTGVPLIVGNVINLDGIKIANSESGVTDEQKAAGYGVIGTDDNGNYTVTWSGQNFTWDGWNGTVYEKAKEDFFGGNAVRTNDPEKPAKIVSEGYKIYPEDNTIAFKQEIKDRGTKSLETPRVNVNELDLTDSNTEWTVYLGTDVDPKSQLQALYDNILVKEVVTAAADTDGDGFPDRMTGTSLYYPLLESFSDERVPSGTDEQVTFKMKELLKKLNNGNDITIDDLITAGEEGITLPYDLYGQDCPGTIKITLKKTGQTAEYDPHATTVTGNTVEKYDLLIDYAPDYVHLPEGQGGDDSLPYHTGGHRLAYPGHAAGEDYSTNNHVINVYEVQPDVYKTDENDQPLSGAVFKLYKAGGSGTISGLNGHYTEVASGTSGTDGVAHLTFAAGMERGLVSGITYFLVEDQAPENYTKVNTVWTVQVQTEIGKFTKPDGEVIYAPDYPTLNQSMYPFNWDQGARIVVDGQPVKAVVKGETAGSTANITDGSYISHKDVISFRHTVKNIRNDIEVEVNKIWQDENNPNRPSSVTVKLYRVSEKGHQWDNGTIVPCTCTENGVKEYTCSVCEAKDTHAINAAGHKRGTPHQENYQAPTCTMPGGYDTVVRCVVCNAIISTEHTELPSPGHTWENQEVSASDPDHYCYDTVDVCTVCGAVNEATRVHHNHDWGDWETTASAAINRAGQEKRVCRHEPSHTEINEISPLPATVNIYFRCTGNGSGQPSYTPTYIGERHKDGVGDMTIQWDWNGNTGNVQSIAVEGLSGGATYNTYTTPDGKEYNVQNGQERGKRQTLTISNITTNQTIYITIRNWNHAGTNNDLIYEPTFAGNYAAPTLNMASPASTRRFAGKSLQKASSTPKLGGEKSEAAIPAVLNGVSGLKSKGEAACEDKYWEEVSGTYLITAANDWSLSIPGLPKYNEYLKEYTYYIEEMPVTGYDTTYSGQGTTNPEIINTPKVTDLTVNKSWAFANPTTITKVEGKDWPLNVTVHVVVYSKTGDNDPVPTAYTVDLTADQQTYTFTGLPEYSGNDKIEYSVVEAGITGLDDTHFNTVIEGNEEIGYTIRNTEKEAGLTIIKAFEGETLTDDQKNNISFTVTGSGLRDRSTGNSVESLTKTYAEFIEGQWVLNSSDGIIANGTYTVTENNANFEKYTRVTSVTVDGGDPNTFAQGNGETNPSADVTMSGYQGTVTITNTYTRLLDLKIIKVDANGMTKLLEGARFELRKVDPDKATLSYLDDAATLPTTTREDHKTGSNGEALFENLTAGYYEIKEAGMPAGYVRTGDGVFYIKVESGEISHVVRTVTVDDEGVSHVTWSPGSNDAMFAFIASSGETPAEAKVGNEPGAALPSTGGPGTSLLYILGIMLTGFAGAGLVMRKRRRML